METKVTKERDKKIKEKFKTGEVVEIVVRALAVIGIVGTSVVFPNFPIVLGTIISLAKELREGRKIEKYKIKKALMGLQKRKILGIEELDGQIVIKVKKFGKSLIIKYSIRELLSYKLKTKSWDKKWRLVLFDVSEEERKKRDFLRRTLKWLGFITYQKSVFVFPYDCKKEIVYLKKILEGKYDIKYLVAEEIDDAERLMKYFELFNSTTMNRSD